MNYEAHRIEGVDNISSDNPLTSQDSRQEEKQMLHVRLPLKGQKVTHVMDLLQNNSCVHERLFYASVSMYLWAMRAL